MIETNNVNSNSAEIRWGCRTQIHQHAFFVFVFFPFSTSWLQKELQDVEHKAICYVSSIVSEERGACERRISLSYSKLL